MSSHITSVASSTNFHLRNISRIRRFIDEDTCKQAVRAMITSRLDYCNSLFANITAKDIQRLQKIQNRSARLIFRVSRWDHTSPLIRKLHWLPIKERIAFKILLLVYKCLNKLAPIYLTELLHLYIPTRKLRSSNQSLLSVNRTFTVLGDCAFINAAPVLWNSLPLAIRPSHLVNQFKNNVKTRLFPSLLHPVFI